MLLSLSIEQIENPIVRENFLRISEFVKAEGLLLAQFKHYEIIFTQAEVNKKIPHRLGFTPKDVIQTYVTSNGDVVWNYEQFDSTYLDVSVSDSCTVRAFIGRYSEAGA